MAGDHRLQRQIDFWRDIADQSHRSPLAGALNGGENGCCGAYALEGDIRAHLLTVGETATIRGEIVADDIVVNGRVIGRVRGLKVRLTSTAKVEGDIIHKTIAIESGAHFEGSVQRQDDPLATGRAPIPQARAAAPAAEAQDDVQG